MIFDMLTVLTAATLLAVGMWFSYCIGKKDRREKRDRASEGWDGIINYDHSEGGVRRDEK